MARTGRRCSQASFALLLALALVCAAASASASSGEAKVRADLEQYVRARADADSLQIQIPRLSVFDVDRERHPGPLRTELSTRSQPPFRGRVPITVALYAGEHLIKRSVVSVTLGATDRVVVPSRDLRRGELIGVDDLRMLAVDAARIPVDALRELESAIGQRVKRSVREDRVLRASAIEGVPVVERGDRVTVVLESGPLQIQGIGRAQEAGAVGDWIRVLNLDSRRELSGRLDDQGRVHVAF